jgi:biotin-(acetyl-CoA carboxylase) ligase
LASISGQSLQFETVAKELIRELDQQYHLLLDGDVHTLESLWKWRLGLLGKNVTVEGLNQVHRGRLMDVTFDGVSIDSDGDIILLQPEAIRHLSV